MNCVAREKWKKPDKTRCTQRRRWKGLGYNIYELFNLEMDNKKRKPRFREMHRIQRALSSMTKSSMVEKQEVNPRQQRFEF